MAEVFIAAAKNILGAKLASTTLAFGTTTLGTVLGYTAYAATYFFVSRAIVDQQARIARSKARRATRGLLTNATDPLADQEIVYGTVRKGGIFTFKESTDGSGGEKNKYLHLILSIAGHEVDNIGDIYINDKVATLNSSGKVTSNQWNQKILIKKFTGSSTQNVYNSIISDSSFSNKPLWSTDGAGGSVDTNERNNFAGQGIACLYIRLEYDQDVFENAIPLFTAIVRGKKVFDPSNNTTAYSSNPALCIRDFITSKYGLNDNNVDETIFGSQATICNDLINLSSASGGGTQKRYECHGVLSMGLTPNLALSELLTSCNGSLFFGQGKFGLKVGYYSTPVKSFTLSDFRSDITLSTKNSRRDTFNVVQGIFANADDNKYQATDYPVQRSQTFITQDSGLEHVLEHDLVFTTDPFMAQRIAKMVLFRAREEMVMKADFSLEALSVTVGDNVSITNPRYGFNNKPFEVIEWNLANDSDAGDLRVKMTLKETSAAAFDWNAEESQITDNNSTLTDGRIDIAPTNLQTTDSGSVQNDGTLVRLIKATWTAAPNVFLNNYEVSFAVQGTSTFTTIEVPASETETELGPVQSGLTYTVRIRGITSKDLKSARISVNHTVGGDNLAPSPPTVSSPIGGLNTVTLNWTAPTTNSDGSSLYDLKGYFIYRSTTNSIPSTPICLVQADKFIDGGLANSTQYYYWIKSVDYSGNVSSSVPFGAVTTSAASGGTDTDTQIYTGVIWYNTLQASAPNDPTATSFNTTTQRFVGLSSDWQYNQPLIRLDNTILQTFREWKSEYKVTIDINNNANISFTTPTGSAQFGDNIASDNYDGSGNGNTLGTAGWYINRDTGYAEFGTAAIRGTLSASSLQLDSTTLDTDANGNLIIKQGGVDTNQIAVGAVIGQAQHTSATATSYYDDTEGRIVNVINGFVKGENTTKLLFFIHMSVKFSAVRFRIYVNQLGTSGYFTQHDTNNVTQTTMGGDQNQSNQSNYPSIYTFASRSLSAYGQAATVIVSSDILVKSWDQTIGDNSTRAAVAAFNAGTYNFCVHSMGFDSDNSQTHGHHFFVQEIKR